MSRCQSAVSVLSCFKPFRDGVAVHRAKGNHFQDQEVQRALGKVRFGESHSNTLRFYVLTRRRVEMQECSLTRFWIRSMVTRFSWEAIMFRSTCCAVPSEIVATAWQRELQG